MITANELDEMSRIDIRTVDPNTLVDIRDVKINHELPKEERILDYIRQIKNPYCFKHGKIIVKVSFSDTEDTFEQKFESYLRSI
ncbi:MAG: hypothetical protein HFE63_07900 [Clostridiales bacterium]|nr:hypothetical protein [Clostridiales bacterium]